MSARAQRAWRVGMTTLRQLGRGFPVPAAKIQRRRSQLDTHIDLRNRIGLAKIIPSTLVVRPDIG